MCTKFTTCAVRRFGRRTDRGLLTRARPAARRSLTLHRARADAADGRRAGPCASASPGYRWPSKPCFASAMLRVICSSSGTNRATGPAHPVGVGRSSARQVPRQAPRRDRRRWTTVQELRLDVVQPYLEGGDDLATVVEDGCGDGRGWPRMSSPLTTATPRSRTALSTWWSSARRSSPSKRYTSRRPAATTPSSQSARRVRQQNLPEGRGVRGQRCSGGKARKRVEAPVRLLGVPHAKPVEHAQTHVPAHHRTEIIDGRALPHPESRTGHR